MIPVGESFQLDYLKGLFLLGGILHLWKCIKIFIKDLLEKSKLNVKCKIRPWNMISLACFTTVNTSIIQQKTLCCFGNCLLIENQTNGAVSVPCKVQTSKEPSNCAHSFFANYEPSTAISNLLRL